MDALRAANLGLRFLLELALPQRPGLALELVVFALGAAGLFAAGATALGVAFAAVVVGNETLLSTWRQR